jgi:hypothetical protein
MNGLIMAVFIGTELLKLYRLAVIITITLLLGCSTPTPHTGSRSLMVNESGESITFTLTPNRIGTPNTAHLDLTPEVMYFVPHNRILREDGADHSFEGSDEDAYRLSVVFNTEEAGSVMVQCDTTYSFGYEGVCNTTVDNKNYSGPLRHYPEID